MTANRLTRHLRALPQKSLQGLKWARKQAAFHWPFTIVLTIFASLLFSLMFLIPPGDGTAPDSTITAPDENAHYLFNVDFIIHNNRLPISGQDDLIAFETCTPNHVGLAPCVYSYTAYPGPNYVISAALVKVAGLFGFTGTYKIARLTSVLSGIAFAIFSYAAAYMIMRRRSFATVLTAAIIFIPQFIFTLSYTNLDAYAAGVSAFLAFSLVGFMQHARSRGWQITLAIALFGLLPAVKFNYFVLGLGALLLIAYTMRTAKFTKAEVLRFAKYALVSFLLLASFWYARNLILYHDLLGQAHMIKTMAEHSPLGTPYPVDVNGFNIAVHRDFFTTLFQSFFFAFGLMHLYLAQSDYTVIALTLVGAAMVLFYHFTQPVKPKPVRRQMFMATALFALMGVCALLAVLINSLVYDFQPQGRYMYPILAPTLLFLALAVKNDKRNGAVLYILLAGTVFLFLIGLAVFIKAYFKIDY